MEIQTGAGASVWRGRGLMANEDGSFVVGLDRSFLGGGDYRIRLFGHAAGESRAIGEYLIAVE